MQDLKNFIKPLYTDCFSVNTNADAGETMNKMLAESFKSTDSSGSKNKQELIGMIQFFWKLIPDMKWEPQEMIQEGDQVVVRSIASGTPKGDFMGMPTDGTKSYKIMTIDIHTVKNNQIQEVHHVEDWATAMQQLKG